MNRLDYAQIPPHMMAALRRYIDWHSPVGGFLTAVLTNDLKKTCSWADDVNIKIIQVYIWWLHNEAPNAAWGSVEKHRAWLAAVKEPQA